MIPETSNDCMSGLAKPAVTLAGVSVCAVMVACANGPSNRYEPPPATATAAYLLNQGGSSAAARFPMVDGKEAPSFGTLVRVAPGVHKLHIQCYHFEITNVTIGIFPLVPILVDSKTELGWFSVTGRLLENQRYYARCVKMEGKPYGYIAASPDGPPLAGFE